MSTAAAAPRRRPRGPAQVTVQKHVVRLEEDAARRRPEEFEIVVDGQTVTAVHSRLDMGPITSAFDGDPFTLVRTVVDALAARVIVADEPFAAVDAYLQWQVMELFWGRAASGAGVGWVLNDLGLAARFCARILLLDKGRIVADGTPGEVLRPALLEPVYGVRMRIIEDQGITIVVPWQRSV